jgi:hypothetical protein
VAEESPDQQAACLEHDHAYARGGTAQMRALADARFLVALLLAGMASSTAERYYLAVRQYGSGHWGNPGPIIWPPTESPPQAP